MDMEIVFPGGKKVDALYKGFTIRTDQPIRSGGDGSAPAPFDLFIASIGTCVGYYVLAFCQARDIPTDGMGLVLRKTRDNGKRMIGKVMIDLQLPTGFPEKYKKAIVRSAGMCAVKKHMMDPPVFEISTRSSPQDTPR